MNPEKLLVVIAISAIFLSGANLYMALSGEAKTHYCPLCSREENSL